MKRELVKKLLPFVLATICCFALGLFAASQIAKEPSGYVASMSFFIFLIVIACPLSLVFLVVGIIFLFGKSDRHFAAVFLMCAFLLPVSFMVSVKALSLLGYAHYDNDRMIPIGSDMPQGFTIIYREGVTYEQTELLGNEVLFPFEKDKGFTYESGICLRTDSPDIDGKKAEEVRFCPNATKEQMEMTKAKVKNSQFVFKIMEEVKPVKE
jgi:hypothetical protein